jgi:hypothetical protein
MSDQIGKLVSKNKEILVILIVASLAVYYVNGQEFFWRPQRLTITPRPGYFHLWHFVAVTTQEYVESGRTIDSVNFPFTSKLPAIINESTIAAIAQITMELVNNMSAHGYVCTVNTVLPRISVSQRQETRQYRDYTEITIYSTLTVDCDVEFQTDKPLAESPLPVWVVVLLFYIAGKLPAIILAVCVGLGIYYGIQLFVSSLVVRESTTTTEYYNEEGNLIKRVVETQKGPDTTFLTYLFWFGMAAMVVLLVWFVGKPMLMRRKQS